MFFLTRDILKDLIDKFYLRNKIIALPWHNSINYRAKLNLFHFEIYIIVQVSDIHYFEKENILAMELYDASTNDANCSTTLDESMWDLVDRKHLPLHLQKKKENKTAAILKIGSVLMLKEY